MPPSTPSYSIRQADWLSDQTRLKRIRTEVFVREQGVPEALEWDDQDQVSLHLVAENETGDAIGTARLLPNGRIGRMAVLVSSRGIGVGGALLEALLAQARQQGLREVHLHAQCSVIEFYQHYGFETEGSVFEEAGISHQAMRLAVQ